MTLSGSLITYPVIFHKFKNLTFLSSSFYYPLPTRDIKRTNIYGTFFIPKFLKKQWYTHKLWLGEGGIQVSQFYLRNTQQENTQKTATSVAALIAVHRPVESKGGKIQLWKLFTSGANTQRCIDGFAKYGNNTMYFSENSKAVSNKLNK